MDPSVAAYKHAVAGSVAGLAAAAVSCPLDIVKFRLQNQAAKGRSAGLLGSLTTIVRLEGVRGLYRGLRPTVAVYMVDRALWFPLYHLLKLQLSRHFGLFA